MFNTVQCNVQCLVLAQSLIRIDSSFRKAPCTQPSINKNLTEMQCLSKSLQVPAQSLIRAFRKSLYFLSQSTLSKATISKTSTKMQCVSNFFQVLAKCFSNISQSRCIKALYERRNGQLLSQSTLYSAFERNAMFK